MNKFRQRQLYEPAHEENSGDVYCSLAHRYSGFYVSFVRISIECSKCSMYYGDF